MCADRLIQLPEAPPPPGAEVVALRAPDDLVLRVARWRPQGEARGAVLLMHGFTEFIEKYYEVVSHLLARGFVVVTYDHRGQGLSQRLLPEAHPRARSGYQADFEDLVAEALFVHERMLAPEHDTPQLVMAHSMGGNVALRMLQDQPGRFEAAVLSAPMMGFDLLPLWLIRVIAGLYVGIGQGDRYVWGVGEVDLEARSNRVTSDAARFARALAFWQHEPELITHGLTWRWMLEAARSISKVCAPARMAMVDTPTLLVSAGRDLVVSSRSHLALESLSDAIEVAYIRESMHEILQESDEIQAVFWDHFDRFVGKTLGSAISSGDRRRRRRDT